MFYRIIMCYREIRSVFVHYFVQVDKRAVVVGEHVVTERGKHLVHVVTERGQHLVDGSLCSYARVTSWRIEDMRMSVKDSSPHLLPINIIMYSVIKLIS